MLLHVVMMKPRSDLSAADRRAFVDALRRAVRDIPSVRAVRTGRRVRLGMDYDAGAPDAASYIAMIEFDDERGLRDYLAHPAHEELGVRFRDALEIALVYDFEMVEMSEL